MRSLSICVCTRFAPSVGGIESLAEMLASEWCSLGHNVEIVTDVAVNGERTAWPFPVHYQPGQKVWRQILRRSDLLVHINISLKALWPWPIGKKPFVAVHQGHYQPFEKRRPWREVVKVQIARRVAWNISASKAVQHSVGCDGVVIPNCFNASTYFCTRTARTRKIAFVGRLVSEKGVPILLEAVRILQSRSLELSVTIIGDGPDRGELERQALANGLAHQVAFVGTKLPADIARLLNEHEILVVPSQYDEPFGIVALEGAACGCVVVGSNGGGLPEAIGPCGETFPNGDATALANILQRLLKDSTLYRQYTDAASEHLEKHKPDIIATRYVEFFRHALTHRKKDNACV